MKTLVTVVAIALAAIAAPATAYAAVSAPAAVGSCDGILKTPTQCAIWTLRCVGDALGGHACHDDAATAQEGPKELVQCTLNQVENVLEGVTPMPCTVGDEAGAAGPDPQKVVACATGTVRAVVHGYTPMPCHLG